MKKPIIGITMGDPAGNGSEISVKALSRSEIYEQCRPVIIGDAACIYGMTSLSWSITWNMPCRLL